MNRLQNFLENHPKSGYKDLIEKPINQLIGINDCRTLKEIVDNFNILTNPMAIIEFNTTILWLVEGNKELAKYKFFTTYLLFGSIFFIIIFPILVSNYWLCFGLLLIPLGVMSSSIIKTPIYFFSWLIVIALSVYSLYSKNYEIFGLIVPYLILKLGLRGGKLFYRDSMVRLAMQNELNFKFLYYIGIVQLLDRYNGQLVKYTGPRN